MEQKFETPKIKQFPIRTTSEWLELVEEAAKKKSRESGKTVSMHQYILDAVTDALNNDLK